MKQHHSKSKANTKMHNIVDFTSYSNSRISQLRNYVNKGDLLKAQELVDELDREGYPDALREYSRKIVRHKATETRLTPGVNIYAHRLHAVIASTSESFGDLHQSSPSWLPSSIIKDYLAQEGDANVTDKDAEKFYNNWLAQSGKGPLDFMRDISEDTIKRCISPLFDYGLYRVVSPDFREASPAQALEHYVAAGGVEINRHPNTLFANKDLYELYPWTRELKVNALYLLIRWAKQFPLLISRVESRYLLEANDLDVSWGGRRPQAALSHFNPESKDFTSKRVLAIANEVSSKDRRISTNPKSLNIHFVIPDFTAGGGGHMTIFRLVLFLEKAGHSCTVWIKDYNYLNHPEGPHASAVKYYQPVTAKILPLSAHFAFTAGDALIATSWDTVEITLAQKSFHDHFYLVQDFEPYFYPRGSRFLESRHTYTQPIKTICASSWLHSKMTHEFGRKSIAFDLSYNPSVYRCTPKKEPCLPITKMGTEEDTADPHQKPIIRLAFYGRSRTERRAVELALEGISLVDQSKFTLVVEIFGEIQGVLTLPDGVYGYDNGILAPYQLAELYNQCDIGLTFSATNYALVPQEMMACGLPVIEIKNDSTQAIYPEGVCCLAEPSARGIAEAIETLAISQDKRAKIAADALAWVQQSSWEKSLGRVEKFICQEVMSHVGLTQACASLADRYLMLDYKVLADSTASDYCVSVVIPTYQPGEQLLTLVNAIQAQSVSQPFEIVILDSSSSDDSIEQLPRHLNLSVYRISKKDFQHGKTRNLGIALAKSELVAFLTQDALPASDYWLANLIRPLQSYPEVWAVFGSHRGHPFHPAYLNRNLEDHFKTFEPYSHCSVYSDLHAYYGIDPSFRQIAHFYSDNNSCLRKSIWEEYPYPDIDYGEDQLWADWVIQSGGVKAFAADAQVCHSHLHDEAEEYERSRTESHFFLKYFGYKLAQSRIQTEQAIAGESRRLLASASPDLADHKDHLIALLRSKNEGCRDGYDSAVAWVRSTCHPG